MLTSIPFWQLPYSLEPYLYDLSTGIDTWKKSIESDLLAAHLNLSLHGTRDSHCSMGLLCLWTIWLCFFPAHLSKIEWNCQPVSPPLPSYSFPMSNTEWPYFVCVPTNTPTPTYMHMHPEISPNCTTIWGGGVRSYRLKLSFGLSNPFQDLWSAYGWVF